MTTRDHPWSWPTILAWGLAVAALAAVVVVLLTQSSTTVVRTVIERAPASPASVTEDNPAGALAAAQAFWAASDANAPADSWTLEYRMDSYTSTAATLEGWGVVTESNGPQWQTLRVTVRYSNGSWRWPASAAGIEVSVGRALDPSSPQFKASIASFHRLPGAP